jgi:hypothetical protein
MSAVRERLSRTRLTQKEGLMRTNNYVDLILSEARPSLLKRITRQYRVCTLSKAQGQQYINLRIPAEMQQKIVSAYQQGKTVRIFA